MGLSKYILAFLVLVCMGLMVALYMVLPSRYGSKDETRIVSQGPTVERLQKLAQLVTLKVTISDVLVGEGAGCKGSWLIKGDALIGIDLNRVEIVEKNEETRQATIRLPRPRVVQSRVDHERTRTWKVEKTDWFGANPDQLRDTVMVQAQALVKHAAEDEENLDRAKTHAEEIIRTFYSEFGWDVKVTWRDDAPTATGK